MKIHPFDIFKFCVMAVIFCVELYVHVMIKELNIFLLASPFVIMGVDPAKFAAALASIVKGKSE